MEISELLPCGIRAPGCIMLQAPPNKSIRVIWWIEDSKSGWADNVGISNIVEEDDADLPEPLARAFTAVLSEIFSDPRKAQYWLPGSLPRAVKKARTVLDLKVGPEGYDKALRAKSRLGQWLEPAA